MSGIAGITIDRTQSGVATHVHINLRKHSYLIPVLEQNGIDIESPIKWSAKMRRSFQQAENGEYYVRSREEVMNV